MDQPPKKPEDHILVTHSVSRDGKTEVTLTHITHYLNHGNTWQSKNASETRTMEIRDGFVSYLSVPLSELKETKMNEDEDDFSCCELEAFEGSRRKSYDIIVKPNGVVFLIPDLPSRREKIRAKFDALLVRMKLRKPPSWDEWKHLGYTTDEGVPDVFKK